MWRAKQQGPDERGGKRGRIRGYSMESASLDAKGKAQDGLTPST